MNYNEILSKIKLEYNSSYIEKDRLPKPFCEDIQNVKLIVLGCDPSQKDFIKTSSDKYFNTVFSLSQKDKEMNRIVRKKAYNYFSGINTNIKQLGVEKNEIYVENICKNYLNKETSKFFNSSRVYSRYIKMNDIERQENKYILKEEYENNIWINIAKLWIDNLKEELSVIDIDVPVLLTSQYQILLLVGPHKYQHIKSMKEYYDNYVIIEAKDNILGRTLIPCSRHYKYHLKKHPEYCNFIRKLIHE